MNQSSPERRAWRRYSLSQHAIDTNWSIDQTDRAVDALEDRVAALEEIAAARWPRRVLLRRRLAWQLRALADGHARVTAAGHAVRQPSGRHAAARPRRTP